MAFIPVLNVVKTVVRVQYASRVYTNSFYWYKPGGWDAITAQDLCDYVRAAWVARILGNQSNGVYLLNVVGYDMEDSAGFVVYSTAAGPTAGTVASPVNPGNVTVAVSLRTANRGKSGRGRIYHIGLAESQTSGNQLATGVDTTLADAYFDFQADVELDAGAVMGIVSFQKDLVVRNPGVFQHITAILVGPNLDSQSRRVKSKSV